MDAVTEACAIRNLEECFGKASRHQAILDWLQASGKRESIPADRKPLPPCCLCLSKGLAEAYQAELQSCLVGFLATRPFGAKLAPFGTGVPKEAKDLGRNISEQKRVAPKRLRREKGVSPMGIDASSIVRLPEDR